jgi:hypothetical protein
MLHGAVRPKAKAKHIKCLLTGCGIFDLSCGVPKVYEYAGFFFLFRFLKSLILDGHDNACVLAGRKGFAESRLW